jgi:hypothetical protein
MMAVTEAESNDRCVTSSDDERLVIVAVFCYLRCICIKPLHQTNRNKSFRSLHLRDATGPHASNVNKGEKDVMWKNDLKVDLTEEASSVIAIRDYKRYEIVFRCARCDPG